MSFEDLLIDRFTPLTLTRTDDGVGGYAETWTEGTAFAGRLSDIGANRRLSQDRLTVYATHTLYCLASVSLTETQKVKLGGRTFQIRSIHNPSNLGHHLQIDLLEVT